MRKWLIALLLSLLTITFIDAQSDYVLVSEAYNAKVTKIDPVTHTEIISIQVADSMGIPIPNVTHLALDTIHHWAYVSCHTADAIGVIDLNTWTATYPNIPVPGMGKQPIGLALNKTADTLYVTTRGPAGIQDTLNPLEIIAISGSTFPPVLTKAGEVPVGKHPINVELSHNGRYAVVSCRNQARLAVVDLRTNTVAFKHDYPNISYEPEGIDVHPIRNLAYCTTHGQNTIDILDFDSLAIVRTININYTGPPPQPSGGLFSPDGSLFLLSAQTTGKVYFFNTADPLDPIQLPPVISVGPQPHKGVFLNDTLAYIPNTNNTQPIGSIAIVDCGATPSNLGNVTGTFNGPLSMVYVKIPSPINDHPTINEDLSNIDISPNPFNSSATMTIRNFDKKNMKYQLRLYDILGQSVKSYKKITAAAITINAADLHPGIYFYALMSGDHGSTRTGKFIVE